MKKSITLLKLIDALKKELIHHPEWGDKEIYFDCLAISGKITETGDLLELY